MEEGEPIEPLYSPEATESVGTYRQMVSSAIADESLTTQQLQDALIDATRWYEENVLARKYSAAQIITAWYANSTAEEWPDVDLT